MLHYLRHIRQKLILQDNVKKYLLYAVGEVLLVVIGILIALQVNNWNESRKQEILKQSYIESLKKDIQLDIEHFDWQIEGINSDLAYLDSLILILNDPGTTNAEFNDLIKNANVVGFTESPKVNNNSYVALRNSGKLDLFDEKLRNMLLSLNRAQQDYIRLVGENANAKTTMAVHYLESIPAGLPPEALQWSEVNWPETRILFYSMLTMYKVTGQVAIYSTHLIKAESFELLNLLESKY